MSSPKPFDKGKLLHLIVIDKKKQKILISVKYRDFDNKKPEDYAINYNPFDGHNGPLTVITKDTFRVLIEGGGWPPISSKNAVLLFIQEAPEGFREVDEELYRERVRKVHDLIERGRLDSSTLYSIKNKIPTSQTQESHWLHILILQNLLSSLDLEWVGLLDIEPFKLLSAIWAIPNSSEKEGQVRDLVVTELCAQIDRGGTTIGLDVERMNECEVLARRIDRILELRANEMNSLIPIEVVHTSTDDGYDVTEVDLEPLWYTAYGNHVLHELSLGKSCDGEDFLDVQEEFTNLGMTLPTNADSHRTNRSKMAESMKEYIRYIANIDVESILSVQDGVLVDIIRGIMS
ncbi:MAG: hypothetical protein P1Q69_00540 [Candidatus Thorarchaeota archaeon]|nr:hypothetical protein [Candidatus Thorarchaeota archaeon]